MSCVRLIVRDAGSDLSGTCHGAEADRVVAALSAEPETIAELEAALERFQKPHEYRLFNCFSRGIDDEPWDAGLVIVDLAARLVVCESTYSSPYRHGHVDYHNGNCATEICLQYHLSDDWKFRHDPIAWEAEAEHRRLQRASSRRWTRGPSCSAGH